MGDPDLLAYERKIRKLVGSTLEIRRKYGDNISCLPCVVFLFKGF